MKTQVTKITSNPLGAIAGGAVAYFAAKKFVKVSNKYALIGITLGGIILGAMAQSKISAKKSVPTAKTLEVTIPKK